MMELPTDGQHRLHPHPKCLWGERFSNSDHSSDESAMEEMEEIVDLTLPSLSPEKKKLITDSFKPTKRLPFCFPKWGLALFNPVLKLVFKNYSFSFCFLLFHRYSILCRQCKAVVCKSACFAFTSFVLISWEIRKLTINLLHMVIIIHTYVHNSRGNEYNSRGNEYKHYIKQSP